MLADRYELRAELGRGAYGVVFRAFDRLAGTEVAIKALGDSVRRSPLAPERVRRELRAAWTVTHPGVVRIHDVIAVDDLVALSMELVEGETLGARLGRGRFELPALVELAHDLAAALAAAHDAGVVHRDLKPSNILLRASTQRAVISDFGLSRIVGTVEPPSAGEARELDSTSELTRTGDLIGTPTFMAPEQLRGATEIGPAADIYALGLVLFEAATGTRAHPERTLPELLRARLERPAPSVASLRPALPANLARVIDDCLIVEVGARIPNGRTLVQRLAAPRWRPRWIVATVAGLAIAGVLAWVLTGSSKPSAAPTVVLPAFAVTAAPGPGIVRVATVPGGTTTIVQRALRDAAGNVVLAGHATAPFAIGSAVAAVPAGMHAGFMVSFAPNGEVRWHHEIAGNNDIQLIDAAFAGSLVVAVGSHHGASDLGNGITIAPPHHEGLADCYIAAFDARDGTARWAHACGATEFGQARTVVADAAGNVYIAGEVLGEVTWGGTERTTTGTMRTSFVASYTAAGALRWTRTATKVTGLNRGFQLAIRGSELLFAGTIIGPGELAGLDISGDDHGDGFVVALDLATGAGRWARKLGGAGDDSLSSVAVDAAGRILVSGTFTGALELVPGHPIVAAGNVDVFVTALAADDAHPVWAVRAGGTHYDVAHSIAAGADRIVVVGQYDIDFAIGDARMGSHGSSDGFLIELGLDGSLIALHGFGGTAVDKPRNVGIDPDGLIRVTGVFHREMDVGGTPIGAAGNGNGFMLELQPTPRAR